MRNQREGYCISKDFFSFPISEKLKIFSYFGSLAPSSHNSQPWFFHVEGNTLQVRPNLKRRLTHSDPNDRQLYLSVGAAIGYICMAAEAYGITHVKTYKETGASGLITNIAFENLDNANPNFDQEFLQALLTRHTNRSPFEITPIPEHLMSFIQNQKIGNATSVRVISDDQTKKEIKKIVVNSTISAFKDKGFTSELSRWMHPSLQKYRDGFVGYNLGIPWPISFIFPWLIRYAPMAKAQGKMEEKLLDHSPGYVIISSHDDSPRQWLDSGETFVRIAVQAEKNKLRIGVFGAPIETKNYYQELQKVIPTDERPHMFFRIGYSQSIPPLSPRMSLETMLV